MREHEGRKWRFKAYYFPTTWGIGGEIDFPSGPFRWLCLTVFLGPFTVEIQRQVYGGKHTE